MSAIAARGESAASASWVDVWGFAFALARAARHGGHERKWSVKQLDIYEDRMEFHPRSTNPRHKPIIKRDNLADNGVTVEMTAIVRRLVAEFNM